MKKVLALLAVLAISAFIIFFKFNLIPKSLTFDEVEFAKLALTLKTQSYVPYSTLATGHSTLYFYILLASFKIFGVGNFGLRLPAAVFGVAASVMFFLLMAKIFRKNLWLPFMAAVAFATSRWFFNFARFSFEATFLLFLEITSLYFLAKSEKSKSSLLLSGIFAGLAFNSYTPGRIFFVVPVAYILMSKTVSRKQIIEKILIYVIPFLIIIAPLTIYLSIHPDNRVDNLFFWKNHEMTLQQKASGTLENISNVFSMFVYKGDMSGKHNYPGKPALNPIIGLLAIAGLAIALKEVKEKNNALFLGYFFISILPSFMIYPWENPNMLRTITAVPAVIYFVGLSLSWLTGKLKSKWIIAVMTVLLIVSSLYELRTYFVYQARVFPSAFETRPTLENALKNTNFKY